MRKELVAEWCLGLCRSAYRNELQLGAGTEARIPALKHAWVSGFLQVALSILCDWDGPRKFQGDLLESLKSGSPSLSDSARMSLVPHLPWIWYCIANRPTHGYAELCDPEGILRSEVNHCFQDGLGCGLWILNQFLPFRDLAALAQIETNTPTFSVALSRMLVKIPIYCHTSQLSLQFSKAVLNWARQSGNVGKNHLVLQVLVNSEWTDLMWRPEQVDVDDLQYVISFLASSDGQHDGIDHFFDQVGSILYSLHHDACEHLPDAFWSISLDLVRIVDGSNPNLNPFVVKSARTALAPWHRLPLVCTAWRLAHNGQVRMSPALVQWALDSLAPYRRVHLSSSTECCVRNAIRTNSELDVMAGGDQDLRTQLEIVQWAFQGLLKTEFQKLLKRLG